MWQTFSHVNITYAIHIIEYHNILQCSTVGLSAQSKYASTNDTETSTSLQTDQTLQ